MGGRAARNPANSALSLLCRARGSARLLLYPARMPQRDFFSFCTTLKPVELKALGELSHVRHLSRGELIYKSADPAEEIYSVNRGVVELTQLVPGASDERTYLSRGDIFGSTETLAYGTRSHSATAQEAASVQCFERKNFADIS